jgi:hypothetical protein
MSDRKRDRALLLVPASHASQAVTNSARYFANLFRRIGVAAEWTPDYTSPQRQAVNPGLIERGSGVGLSIEYVRANV